MNLQGKCFRSYGETKFTTDHVHVLQGCMGKKARENAPGRKKARENAPARHRRNLVQGPVSRRSRKVFGPGKP